MSGLAQGGPRARAQGPVEAADGCIAHYWLCFASFRFACFESSCVRQMSESLVVDAVGYSCCRASASNRGKEGDAAQMVSLHGRRRPCRVRSVILRNIQSLKLPLGARDPAEFFPGRPLPQRRRASDAAVSLATATLPLPLVQWSLPPLTAREGAEAGAVGPPAS
jgi:hypothetical protein